MLAVYLLLLRNIMVRNGFRPLDTEWWHFTLENEPYPDTYFIFPVERGYNPFPRYLPNFKKLFILSA